MILADKIMNLRKKNGWSQEELAEKLNVTRQSVSKWESAQSIPDLDKILLLSQIFGVSTDYLIKDELEVEEFVQTTEEPVNNVIKVSLEQANEFLKIKAKTAKTIAVAIFLCILSPICLFVLAVASETGKIALSEDAAGGIGLIVLMIFVAIACALFISCGMKTKPYEFLEKEMIDTEYGVIGMVKERKQQYHDTYTKGNIIGTVLCILSLIPLFACAILNGDDYVMVFGLAAMLVICGIGVMNFIHVGINWASMEKLLQEGDYTVKKKQSSGLMGKIMGIYWLAAVAIYLGYSMTTNNYDVVVYWPVAGLLCAIIAIVCRAFHLDEK